MMNEQARAVFSELLTANYEYSQMEEGARNGQVTSIMDMITLGKRVSQLRSQFKEAMGDGYEKFMSDGAKMFAPRQ